MERISALLFEEWARAGVRACYWAAPSVVRFCSCSKQPGDRKAACAASRCQNGELKPPEGGFNW